MDLKAEVERIRSTIVPLGRAGAVAQNPALRQAIMDATAFLLPKASLTERMHCIAHDIIELPMCTACHIKPAPWSPHKQLYRPSCGPKCGAVLKPIKERKQRQKELEESFVLPELTMEGFDRLYAANFLRENCLRKDGQLNGNLTQTPRNFVAMFGETEFVKVMSDHHLNHSGTKFALYAYLLDHGRPMCEQCGENETDFVDYKDGFRRTCSTLCGNNLADKKDSIREKLTQSSRS